MSTKQRIIVICPGRGSYNASELGYLQTHHADKTAFIEQLDAQRTIQKQPTITELDQAENFSPSLHLPGENASTLIYACAFADFLNINQDKYEIVAITGNSMGWYIALACAGVLDTQSAFTLINTMGNMMQNGIIGGQLIYPITDSNWHHDLAKVQCIEAALTAVNQKNDCEAYYSIHLGGYAVIGGNNKAISYLMKLLPLIDETYPMKLNKHAAFHTPLLEAVSQQAFEQLPLNLFRTHHFPLIDGRGHIWQPYSTDVTQLHQYTLGHQVTQTYDFTAAITVALKEFCPDKLILLGPGYTLGGAIGQILVQHNWQGMTSKTDFTSQQKTEPFLIAMGMANQKLIAT